jgi:hypothetical protein
MGQTLMLKRLVTGGLSALPRRRGLLFAFED